MSGPLPPVSSLTTAILLNVLNGTDIGGNPRQPASAGNPPPQGGARNDANSPPNNAASTPAAGNQTTAPDRRLSSNGSNGSEAAARTAAPASASAALSAPGRQAAVTASPLMQEAARQLRQALPAQQPLPATLVRLWQWFRDASLPAELAPLRTQVRDAVSRLPTREALGQPDGLRNALRNSGLFAPATDASAPTRPDDLRQLLSRLADAFRQQAVAPHESAPALPTTGKDGAATTPGPALSGDRPAQAAENAPAKVTANTAGSVSTAGAAPDNASEGLPRQAPVTTPPAASEAHQPGPAASGQSTAPTQAGPAPDKPLPPESQPANPPTTEASVTRPGSGAGGSPRETAGQEAAPQHRTGSVDARVNAYLPAQNSGDDNVPGRVQPQARQALPDLQTAWHKAALGDMADLLQGNLARLDAHQLQSLQQAEQGRPQWLMELPVRDHDGLDLWQVHVQRDPDGRRPGPTRDADSTWQVTLSFCFERSGPMVARLRLQGENLQVIFHSEQADTATWLQRHAGALEASLQAAGLSQVKVSQVSGLPHRDNLPAMTPATGLQVRA